MSTIKQAVSQQEETVIVETAQLADQVATFLVPNYNEGQKLAIVDEGVLKYLKSLLPKARTSEIIDQLIGKLKELRYKEGSDSLQLAVNEAKDFVAFHESINLLNRYFNPGNTIAYKEPFNKEPKPLTLEQLVARRHELEDEMSKVDDMILQANKDKEPELVVNH